MGGMSDFADLLTDTVTIEPATGRDGFGHPTYGAAVTVAARVVEKPRIVRDPTTGEEVVSTAQIRLGEPVAVGIEDRITLSSGEVPRILYVRRAKDETGAEYVLVYGTLASGGAVG